MSPPRPRRRVMVILVMALAVAPLLVLARALPNPVRVDHGSIQPGHDFVISQNVSTCPGYALNSLTHTNDGFVAQLHLAGRACNAFGRDVSDLTLVVSHESKTRLHVHIYDTAQKNYQIPLSVITRPLSQGKKSSDLEFHFTPHPFEFWITRRGAKGAPPLFDTRSASIPNGIVGQPVVPEDQSTVLNGFPLVFEDQYLQLTSALPRDTNIYGLGEVVASSGFRRDVLGGTIQSFWARDAADPLDENVYGSHPMYLEHRYDERTGKSQSHGVFLLSAAPADILLLTPHHAKSSLIQYRLVGGTLDFYFLAGPTPIDVVEQYAQVVGLPTLQPAWGFGFQLCRWGYKDLNMTKDVVRRMREAGVPLEVMWNDIDLYEGARDFTTDRVRFPTEDMRAFVRDLAAHHQKYIPIVDAAIAKQVNESDIYAPYSRGVEEQVFMTNPDGSEYIGQVWPGYTVFPDWFATNTQRWWTECFRNWTAAGGVELSGVWLDMNEVPSFCEGSCGTGADLSNRTLPFPLPGEPGNIITEYPECYDPKIHGPSGNMTVNGTWTCDLSQMDGPVVPRTTRARPPKFDLNEPPYAIHNGYGRLSSRTIATNATHAGGEVELDVHSMWGLMEEKATHATMRSVRPGKRPFLISRSTFPSSGRWSGHWLGDNYSKWRYMHLSIQGVLQFQLFQIPFTGADTCGFHGNADEELCNRWMQLAAFTPFYRNHNIRGSIGQEPYRWDSVAHASRTAIATRYSLLPYWYTLFMNASRFGTPPVRALFFEFPDQPELFGVDRQFMIGRDILITPVLAPNASTVQGIFPGRGKVLWRDWYTHDVVHGIYGSNATATLSAPLGHIPVHVREGAALLLYGEPGYTIEETRRGPFKLLVVLSRHDGRAFGTVYLDDGDSDPPGPARILKINAMDGQITIEVQGEFEVESLLREVVVLGTGRPGETDRQVRVQRRDGRFQIPGWTYDGEREKLVLSGLDLDLNQPIVVIEW